MQNAECRMQRAKCRMQKVEVRDEQMRLFALPKHVHCPVIANNGAVVHFSWGLVLYT